MQSARFVKPWLRNCDTPQLTTTFFPGAELLHSLGTASFRLGQTDEAVEFYEKVKIHRFAVESASTRLTHLFIAGHYPRKCTEHRILNEAQVEITEKHCTYLPHVCGPLLGLLFDQYSHAML